MEKVNFTCNLVNKSDTSDLAIELWLDNVKFFDNSVPPGEHPVRCEFEDSEEEHVLQFVLKNKTVDHTQVSENGEILSDALIEINNICFDDINIDQIVYQTAKYIHNQNNTAETIEDSFFGPMGCNGTVKFEFTGPFYVWLLEHM